MNRGPSSEGVCGKLIDWIRCTIWFRKLLFNFTVKLNIEVGLYFVRNIKTEKSNLYLCKYLSYLTT